MTELEALLQGGQEKWGELYKLRLSLPISDPERFFKALEVYGAWPMYEAICLTSTKKIDGDPFPYLLSVAHNKWKERAQEEESAVQYQMKVDMAKNRAIEKNEALASKIIRARKKLGGENNEKPNL